MTYTDKDKIVPKPANELGWRDLTVTQGDLHLGEKPNGRTLAALIHLSDLHICDAESPSRIEYLDRYADANSPYRGELGHIGTYRANEILTTQVLATMVETINEIDKAPLTGAEIDAVVITGDMTDNAQQNETDWYLKVLNGGEVHPASGNIEKSEWVGSKNVTFDAKYWHPDGAPAGEIEDEPTRIFGFPKIAGLVEAARKKFLAKGLNKPWFAIYGNHDLLLQGTVAPDKNLTDLSTGDERIIGLPLDFKIPDIKPSFAEVGPVWYLHNETSPRQKITSDKKRAFNDASEFAKAHLVTGGHGFTQWNADSNRAYWSKDLNEITLIAMDTVNPWGGWQGSIDEAQLNWIESLLIKNKDRYVVLLSHHPAFTWINNFAPPGEPRRVLVDELMKLLDKHKNVICWIAGHVHYHWATYLERSDGSKILHVTTSSQVDWPQQGRIIEIVKEADGQIAFGSTAIDHKGEINWHGKELNHITMAGISRELAGNDWQYRDDFFARPDVDFETSVKNVIWRIQDPFS
jgi:metallophosphoesterase (TIGR03767 family)